MPRNAQDLIQKYNDAKTLRNTHEQQFRMNAAYCLPREYSRWNAMGSVAGVMGGNANDTQARFAFDNTGIRATMKYGAICKRLINPDNIKYHALIADNDELMKIPAVRMYFEALTDKLFKMRHDPGALFNSAQAEVYQMLGVYGSGPKSLTWDKSRRGFQYKAWPLYDIYFLVDDFGKVTDVFRRFGLTKRQFKLKWPEHPMPQALASKQDSDNAVEEFVHIVSIRAGDYDEKALDARRHEWASHYLCVKNADLIGEEEGFATCPYTIPTTMTTAGDPYGYSPAEQAFPALGGVNAMKKTVIKLGHKAVDPPLLANDDGALSGRVDYRPGRVTYGGVNKQGVALVKELQTNSNFRVAEQLISDEREDINDSFLVTLFTILTDTPEMTAAEVYERVAEKAALFAPTMAALQEKDQAPQVDREISLLASNGLLPPMPPEMVEAKGEFRMTYTNPMNKALHATEVSGFMRWTAMLTEAAAASQNPEPLDHVNWDEAAPDIAYKMDVRTSWVATEDQVDAKRKGRAEQAKQAAMIQAAPAAASIAATAAKTGAPV